MPILLISFATCWGIFFLVDLPKVVLAFANLLLWSCSCAFNTSRVTLFCEKCCSIGRIITGQITVSHHIMIVTWLSHDSTEELTWTMLRMEHAGGSMWTEKHASLNKDRKLELLWRSWLFLEDIVLPAPPLKDYFFFLKKRDLLSSFLFYASSKKPRLAPIVFAISSS